VAVWTKTLAEHTQFVYSFERLQLWYAWHWLHGHPQDDFYYCIRERIHTYRSTDFFDDAKSPAQLYQEPGWREVEEKIKAAYHRSTGAEEFENTSFAYLREAFDRRAQKEYLHRTDFSKFQAGSLRYDPPTNPVFPGKIFIHIANACVPQSIFDDPAYLPTCLLELMDKAWAEFGIDRLGTST
jgi:hypothetical protein